MLRIWDILAVISTTLIKKKALRHQTGDQNCYWVSGYPPSDFYDLIGKVITAFWPIVTGE